MTSTQEMDKLFRRVALLEDCVRVLLETRTRTETVRVLATRPDQMAIIEAVAVEHGLKVGDLFRRTSARAISWPRQVAFLRLRETGLSLLEIAAVFDVDHTTVMHGIRAAEGRGAQ